ncbi:MAG: hypothetical protein A2X08_18240 [Bacteroidetes bacterium GWA2_32_17]|nr:MAG: hypothetical protein A2X08_18240 [Bacteroidetes bacterium GWA2_32_17]
MKKSLVLSIFVMLSIVAFAQAQQSFQYQAVVRDASGTALQSHAVNFQLSIISDSITGTVEYVETHATTTNAFGIVTLAVGSGNQITGTFSGINWGIAFHFIKVEADLGSGLIDMGTTQLLSVPYSLFSEQSGNGDVPVVINGAGATTVTGTYPNFTISSTDNVNDADADATNEIQVLSISNDTMYLSNGGYVFMGNYSDTLWKKSGNSIYNTNSDNVGVGINNPAGRMVIQGSPTALATDPLFEVKNSLGQSVFVVWQDSVQVYINDDAIESNRGGFAVSGRNMSKTFTNNYLKVTPDSTRIYLNDNPAKSGFAVKGYNSSGGSASDDFFSVNSDSIKASKSMYLPRLTTTERDNLGFTPSEALIIFNTTDKCMQIYETGVWSNIWCFHCAPNIITQPFSTTICSETNTSFTVSSTGTNLVYQWQQSTDGGTTWSNISDGGTNPAILGSTSWTVSFTNVPVGYNGYKYRCNITAGCPPGVTSNVVTLNVGSTPPVFTTQPSAQILSTGCTASFSVTSPGYGVTYQWQVSADGGSTWNIISNGGTNPAYSNATTASLSMTSVPLSFNNYKYLCVVGNACGANATSTSATLTVSPAPTITTQPSDLQLPNSYTANFTIVVSGTGMLYQWQQSADGGSTWSDIINGGTNPTYSNATTASISITNVPITFNAYKFRCIVSHFCRPSVTSNTATLNITIPTLTTTAISSITSITAISGGNVTLDGGATVTARGVCWSTSANPVATGSHTTDGTGTGTFTSNITGLTLGLTYYVRAYATNGIGTAYGNEISFCTNTVDIGQSYQGGIVAYILQPGDPGYIVCETHGLIAAPSDQSTGIQWYNGSYTTTGATATAIGTGNANTITIVANQGAGSYAAQLCADLVLGAYSDWYLPSKDELNKLYLNKVAIGGFANFNYWSSSEYDNANAWRQYFLNGNQYNYDKLNPNDVRAVRAF